MKLFALVIGFWISSMASSFACALAGQWERQGGNGVVYKYIISADCGQISVSAGGGAFETYAMKTLKNGWRYKADGATLTFKSDGSVHVRRGGWSGSGGSLVPAQF